MSVKRVLGVTGLVLAMVPMAQAAPITYEVEGGQDTDSFQRATLTGSFEYAGSGDYGTWDLDFSGNEDRGGNLPAVRFTEQSADLVTGSEDISDDIESLLTSEHDESAEDRLILQASESPSLLALWFDADLGTLADGDTTDFGPGVVDESRFLHWDASRETTSFASLTGTATAEREVAEVPVPATLPLFGTGVAILSFLIWRNRRLKP
ncbi:PEP-CTERM sorting domain-containing protein [Thioalkalivibrio sp. ALJ24]|uniref:PEP-CTERM sorting domain-containing protein n=1 Tax=Thioalkalivibrio sp. ALJ24 TaxID=545276 RepID=UPI0018DD07FD|nr:PEP-CTERM sorting domain-containing protein [Thioalkalivibrio sp. ALJ24]